MMSCGTVFFRPHVKIAVAKSPEITIRIQWTIRSNQSFCSVAVVNQKSGFLNSLKFWSWQNTPDQTDAEKRVDLHLVSWF